MADEDARVEVSRTSAQTAEASPIVLRETKTTRLIFRPVLLDNPHDAAAAIDGQFTYQRKGRNDDWQDHTELPLSKLKAEEWVRLELKAAELLALYRGLEGYYRLVAEHGLGRGRREFVPAPENEALRALLRDEGAFAQTLQDAEVAGALLSALLKWIYTNEQAIVAAQLEGISVQQLQEFDAVLALARLAKFCEELDEHYSESSEDYWQSLLERYSWVIAQVYAVPLMIVRGQVYVGGKTIANTGGNTADFLYQNRISGNVVLVEIKTPATPLTGAIYRNNVYNISKDLAGATLQILNAKQSLIEDYRSLANEQLVSGVAVSPRGLLIIGSQQSVPLTGDETRSFEMFRNNQRDIDIVTFDELRAKVQSLVDLLRQAGVDR